jgi:hypothetical protein
LVSQRASFFAERTFTLTIQKGDYLVICQVPDAFILASPIRTINPEKFKARRRQIRAPALTCFRRAGFHGAGMADICAEAIRNERVGAVVRRRDARPPRPLRCGDRACRQPGKI